MDRFSRTAAKADGLVKLGKILQENIQIVKDEWAKEGHSPLKDGYRQDSAKTLPSRRLHQTQHTILPISGALTEAVSETYQRLQEVSAQYWEARCMAIAAERRIPDLLHAAGEQGLDIETLAKKTTIE